jgi:hypothetical protein
MSDSDENFKDGLHHEQLGTFINSIAMSHLYIQGKEEIDNEPKDFKEETET